VAFARASPILSPGSPSQADPERFEVRATPRLHESATRDACRVPTAIAGGDYLNALGAQLAWTGPVDRTVGAVRARARQRAVRAMEDDLGRGQRHDARSAGREGRRPGRDEPHRPASTAWVYHYHRGLSGVLPPVPAVPRWPDG